MKGLFILNFEVSGTTKRIKFGRLILCKDNT